MERSLVRFFPALAGRRIEHAWGGPIDVSPSHLPMIGSLDGGRVHYACGYTGNGVGPSHLAGRTLASLRWAARQPSRLPLIDAPGGRVPPEPLRYLGGTVVRKALVRREQLEERGSAPVSSPGSSPGYRSEWASTSAARAYDQRDVTTFLRV